MFLLVLSGCAGVTPWKPGSVDAIIAKHQPENYSEDGKPLPANRKPDGYPVFLSPVAGMTHLLSPFGRRDGKPHEGIDIAAKEGTALQATAAGVVIYTGSNMDGYGETLVVKHEENFYSVYAHLSQILVKEGQKVAPGKIVARSGSTGRASGPHLHFELRRGQKPFDPAPHIFPIVLP